MGDVSMTAFKVIRFRVKPGREEKFLNAHRNVQADWPGLKKVNMIKSGDRSYCIIGEWADMTDLVAALNPRSFRDTLEDLGDDLGVTDSVSGPVVLERTLGLRLLALGQRVQSALAKI
jgi:heme-degrading monooxygenase HmoA